MTSATASITSIRFIIANFGSRSANRAQVHSCQAWLQGQIVTKHLVSALNLAGGKPSPVHLSPAVQNWFSESLSHAERIGWPAGGSRILIALYCDAIGPAAGSRLLLTLSCVEIWPEHF